MHSPYSAATRTPRITLGVFFCLGLSLMLSQAACVTPTPRPQAQPWNSAWEEPWDSATSEYVLPERQPATWPTPAQASSAATSSNITEIAYKLYSQHLTKIDGSRCPCRPTCSRYGVLAARKHGLVIGIWMTLDRLMLSTDETRSSVLRSLPLREFGDDKELYYDDPVEENDFFF